MFKVEEAPASWQAGFWIMARSWFDRYPAELSLEEVCRRVGIGRSSAYAAQAEISRRLLGRPPRAGSEPVCRGCRAKDFEIEVLRYERDHPGCRGSGDVRLHFTPGYKECVEEARSRHGITILRASEILSIPEDTLKKFSRVIQCDEVTVPPQELPPEVIDLANQYLREGKGSKSVKGFCRRYPECLDRLGLTYRQALGWLRELGLVSPRGIFLKNTGLDRIIRFKPHQLWATDGKRLALIFNGEVFESSWQCLVDGATTAIVGGVVRDEENTENLVEALEQSAQKTGTRPIAIVMDNRLSENLPAVRDYFEKRGVEIVKIFPGNSKSNGIAEENFNVFERWVGRVQIQGRTPAEIARSIQQALVEVFTQMRNHKPRGSLSMKTPLEVMEETPPATPEEERAIREKLKAMADRLKNEQAKPLVSEQKKAAIQQAIERTNPPHPDVFEKRIQDARFTPELILSALAILETARQTHPHKSFGHAYFGGILRRLAAQQILETLHTNLESVYAHHWDTMGKLKREDLALSIRTHPETTCLRLSSDFIHMSIPTFASRLLVDLKDAFIAASRGSAVIAERLRKSIVETVIQSRRATQERRERLLHKVYEWENFIRITDREAGPWVVAPTGNA